MIQSPISLPERPTNDFRWRAEAGDVLTAVMDAVRLRSRVFCRSELKSPWGIALRASSHAHFHVIERGGCWLRLQDQEPLALAGGDLVVIPHGTGHTLTDSPKTKARPLEQMVAGRTSEAGCLVMRGGGEGVETSLVCGAFRFERPDAHPLLALLPPLIHIRPAERGAAEWLEATLRFLAWETREAGPGTETIISRLTDVIFVQALRAWIESLPEGRGGWLGALRDRHVGAALGLIHRVPERDWTNASLASEVGLSRSRFAARFTALVGQPPLTYLTRWRMEKAASLLQEGDRGLAEIAASVGYESEAAFSKAFRRRFGLPPGAYRRRVAA